MLFPGLVGLGALAFTATFLLSPNRIVASENHTQGHRQLTECTQRELFQCYWEYTRVFSLIPLHSSDEGELDESYREACRFLNTTSICYQGSSRCPVSTRMNFTRREEGYRMLRTLVCDIEAFKGSNTAWDCTDSKKMALCILEHKGDFRGTHPDYEENLCREFQAQRACVKKTWNSSCPMILESAVAAVGKALDALELMNDCKSMYYEEPAPYDINATAFNNLTADVDRMRAILQENVQAMASLSEKVDIIQKGNERLVKESDKILRQQAASMESIKSIEKTLHELRKEIARGCRSQS